MRSTIQRSKGQTRNNTTRIIIPTVRHNAVNLCLFSIQTKKNQSFTTCCWIFFCKVFFIFILNCWFEKNLNKISSVSYACQDIFELLKLFFFLQNLKQEDAKFAFQILLAEPNRWWNARNRYERGKFIVPSCVRIYDWKNTTIFYF